MKRGTGVPPNWTADDLATHMARMLKSAEREPIGIVPQLSAKPTGRLPAPKGLNKTEESYSQHLRLLHLAGDILWWGFEAMKVRIGKNCYFSPDFLVMYADSRLELHDTKGRKGKTYYAEDDSIVKARATSANFPLPMFFVFRRSDGEWEKVEM